MNVLTAVLLAVSTLAALLTVFFSYQALVQSNQAAFHQYQAQTLANLESRYRRVEKIGYLVSDIGNAASLNSWDVVRARSRLPHAMVGYEDRFPNCLSMASAGPHAPAAFTQATMEVHRELTVLAAAEQAVSDRNPPVGELTVLWRRIHGKEIADPSRSTMPAP